VPPLLHHVIAGTADEPTAVECAERGAGLDALLNAVGRPARVADRPERAAAQIQFGSYVVAGVQRTELDVAQRFTRAFP
jgi:hypothetical protein